MTFMLDAKLYPIKDDIQVLKKDVQVLKGDVQILYIKTQSIETELKQMKLDTLDNGVIPRLQNIESEKLKKVIV